MFLSKKHTTIFIIFTLLFSLSITGCRAQDKENNNSANQTEISTQENSAEIKDPDLDLSIEELRKKYPINWMEEKYGDYMRDGCEDPGDVARIIPDKLICRFVGSEENSEEDIRIIRLDVFKDFSENQIKSIILHSTDRKDIRVDRDIMAIITKDVLDNRKNQSKLAIKIKNFLYSDLIMQYLLQVGLTCDALYSLDDQSKYYEAFFLKYKFLRELSYPA